MPNFRKTAERAHLRPITQEDVNELQAQNLPEGTRFYDEPDTVLASGGRFWVSTDAKYYIELGIVGKIIAGMDLDGVSFCTQLGYVDMASTAKELETAHIDTHEK